MGILRTNKEKQAKKYVMCIGSVFVSIMNGIANIKQRQPVLDITAVPNQEQAVEELREDTDVPPIIPQGGGESR
jgi:hypothetical protein